MIGRRAIAPLLASAVSLFTVVCSAPTSMPTPQPTSEARNMAPVTAGARAPTPTKESPVLVPIAQAAESTATPVPPTATPTPVPTPTTTPTVTPSPTTTPSPVLKTFELVCPACTPEQLKTFSENAKEDYLSVLKLYGIDEKDVKMVVGVGESGYAANFYFGGRNGVGVGLGPDDFVRDRREVKHEMAHAINHTLFPTYHSWFDEGMAMYASRELTHPGYKKNFTELKSRGTDWFNERKTPNVNPDHLLGSLYFTAIEVEYSLTPEKNRTALSLLRKRYIETRRELTKDDIQQVYETALGLPKGGLNTLFYLLRDGVMILYSSERIKSEF